MQAAIIFKNLAPSRNQIHRQLLMQYSILESLSKKNKSTNVPKSKAIYLMTFNVIYWLWQKPGHIQIAIKDKIYEYNLITVILLCNYLKKIIIHI